MAIIIIIIIIIILNIIIGNKYISLFMVKFEHIKVFNENFK